ncbi:GDP-L-fucose synthase [SAR92 clade bacterium H231]|nr:GDP-L-fucose synthase [SAR92 clade bacterium H231]
MLNTRSKIYVAGHLGLVGSAIVRKLMADGYGESNIVTCTHSELDLTNQQEVKDFFQSTRIDFVILAAAKVGGINANNTYPAEFIYQNLMIQSNVIHEAYLAQVEKLLFLGSSCIYPRMVNQPMSESAMLTGVLEPTNEPYALAKIAGIKLCESYNRQYGTDYRSVMPTNLYGLNDNFDLENSHVIPALMRKVHEAKLQGSSNVEVWGTGKVMREFLYVDDMAEASLYVLGLDKQIFAAHTEPMLSHINVGSGVDVTIRELAETIVEVVGFEGELKFDISKPDGAPRKLLNIDRLKKLGWQARHSLKEGLTETYGWYLKNIMDVRS